MALGHRFTAIVVRNVSTTACLVEGVPGIGVRGGWGRTFVPGVERDSGSTEEPGPVELAPGASALDIGALTTLRLTPFVAGP